MFGFLDFDEGPMERMKTRVFICILALALTGELLLILMDLAEAESIANNLIVLMFLAASVSALALRRKTLAVYLVLLPFTVDFFRVYLEAGPGTHALPLLFLLVVEAVYLLPTVHSLIFVGCVLTAFNTGAYYGFSTDDSGKLLIVANAAVVGITLIFSTVFFSLKRYFAQLEDQNAHLDDLVRDRTRQLDAERQRSENLLLNVLPGSIAERLKDDCPNPVDDIARASVLFADIAGFTALSKSIAAGDLVAILNDLFSAFDELVERHGLEKIKTIGDAYMVAGGVPNPSEDDLERLADFALDLRAVFRRRVKHLGLPLQLRIGIHAGPVVAGIIGTKKFLYDLWGETVNLASRMESTGMPEKIQVTQTVHDALAGKYVFARRGAVDVKGVGRIDTWYLEDHVAETGIAA